MIVSLVLLACCLAGCCLLVRAIHRKEAEIRRRMRHLEAAKRSPEAEARRSMRDQRLKGRKRRPMATYIEPDEPDFTE